MSFLRRLLGADGNNSDDPERIARTILERYQFRRTRGDLRVDNSLFMELSQVLPEKSAQDVFERFRTRRSRSDPKAESLLILEIGVSMHDADHYARTFGRGRPEHQRIMPGLSQPSGTNIYWHQRGKP